MLHAASDPWEHVDALLDAVSRIRLSIAVHLVACVKGTTPAVRDFETHSLQTEFFSDAELNYLIGSLREFGLFVRLFSSEAAFIESVLVHGAGEGGFERTIVYNTAHSGTGPGRKALVPAFCDLRGIAYTGSDPHAATLARHKYHCWCVLKNCGVPVPDAWFFIPGHGWLFGNRPPDGSKVILKLTYESASIGLTDDSVLTVDATLTDRLRAMAASFHQPITIQQFISGREAEVPIIHLKEPFAPLAVSISVNGTGELGDEILTYDLVNEDHYGFSELGADSDDLERTLQRSAIEAAQILGFRGLSRVDFRINQQGRHFATDLATSPHIIRHSSFEFAFRRFGREGKLPALLVALGCARAGWI